MPALPANFYAEFRLRCGVVEVLQDEQDSPPERLLQAIWQHQRLLRDQLKTLDGLPVRVLHPGFHNLEGGPDFRSAVLELGDGSMRTGDIEVDLRANGWHAHGHDRNPAFRNVILHVLWDGERPASGGPPVLLLRQVLDAPLGELSLWLGGERTAALPEEMRGRCSFPLRQLPRERLQELLRQAAHVRLRSKAAQFEARARRVGWEQALWEGLFRALGYKHNVWPMQRLAELRPQWMNGAGERLQLEARLLGISGLLPGEVARPARGADGYVRRLWDIWWRERDGVCGELLPKGVWRLHGLRPANHPQRRLALAAGWSLQQGLPAKLQQWCAAELKPRGMAPALAQALEVPEDEFWSWHWTLQSGKLKRAQPLLGASRVTDLAVNVVLPWLWMRAVEGKNEPVRDKLEQRYFDWPAAQDNAVLRLARERLLGSSGRLGIPGAAAQQGLLQLVRDFCDHSNSICEECKLPELVKEIGSREFKPELRLPDL